MNRFAASWAFFPLINAFASLFVGSRKIFAVLSFMGLPCHVESVHHWNRFLYPMKQPLFLQIFPNDAPAEHARAYTSFPSSSLSLVPSVIKGSVILFILSPNIVVLFPWPFSRSNWCDFFSIILVKFFCVSFGLFRWFIFFVLADDINCLVYAKR